MSRLVTFYENFSQKLGLKIKVKIINDGFDY